jgi:hypothetical protein
MDDPIAGAVYRPFRLFGRLSVIYVRDEMNIEFITPPDEIVNEIVNFVSGKKNGH